MCLCARISHIAAHIYDISCNISHIILHYIMIYVPKRAHISHAISSYMYTIHRLHCIISYIILHHIMMHVLEGAQRTVHVCHASRVNMCVHVVYVV